jgi:homoaconitase/3-isopropylmalate dehydratase large subunit
MAPEYGATIGYFPVDEQTLAYLEGTGRRRAEIEWVEAYFRAQGLFGVPDAADIDYTRCLQLDLATVAPSLAGPRRPMQSDSAGPQARFVPPLAAVDAAHDEQRWHSCDDGSGGDADGSIVPIGLSLRAPAGGCIAGP